MSSEVHSGRRAPAALSSLTGGLLLLRLARR
jgi:hypothetical protein